MISFQLIRSVLALLLMATREPSFARKGMCLPSLGVSEAWNHSQPCKSALRPARAATRSACAPCPRSCAAPGVPGSQGADFRVATPGALRVGWRPGLRSRRTGEWQAGLLEGLGSRWGAGGKARKWRHQNVSALGSVRKSECFKHAHALNTVALNKKMGPQVYFVGCLELRE